MLFDESVEEFDIDESILDEFYRRSERKKEDEKWLNEHKQLIRKGLLSINKNKVLVNNYQINMVEPDNSGWNMDRVLEFLTIHNLLEKATKPVVDEAKLMVLIENGEISLDALKEYAWIERKGTPRITVKRVI